ncbi:GNAT family N-acetyltransferase [Actinophytocola glycyrrhizae]|uniref:GNAT family N-acetyltransferase n=1 Tax=Actinophytocola glycyrrhizae TaxID=2044873 RepID=A0ABV9RTL1_9PSEU
MDAVTDVTTVPPAVEAALRAAGAAGVTVRELTAIDDFAAVCTLFQGIWRTDPASPLVTTELLRALTKAGNYLAGAFDGPTLVGACVGFFGAPADGIMHSHIAGVSAAAAGRHVGHALKLHQRAWALRRGVTAIEWTFDPLVARNAWFNLGKLGATATEYLPDFYGGMHDLVNGGDDTDRLLVRWDLDHPTEFAGAPGHAVVALGRTAAGAPEPGTTTGATLLVAVPSDIAAVRAAAPGRAREWRVAVRDVLGGLLADGARVAGFDRAGWYVVTREDR